METIIQAGNKKLKIESVPVTTNDKTRESRLFKSTGQHVRMSAAAIVRAYIMYKPYVIFSFFAGLFGILGLIPFIRYAVIVASDHAPGSHFQSLLVGAVLLVLAFMSVMLGITADLIRTNRTLIEVNLEHTKKIRYGRGEFLSETEQLLRREPTANVSYDIPAAKRADAPESRVGVTSS